MVRRQPLPYTDTHKLLLFLLFLLLPPPPLSLSHLPPFLRLLSSPAFSCVHWHTHSLNSRPYSTSPPPAPALKGCCVVFAVPIPVPDVHSECTGYQIGLKLLRAGAEVIATSRFPKNTANRYALESDFAAWSSRLHVYGIDLRDIASIDALVAMVKER